MKPFSAPTLIACVLAAAAGCSSAPVKGQSETPASATAAPAPEFSGAAYVIGPGDTVQVFVWRNPELSVTVPVRPDGRVSTPLVEDMVAVGKTPTQLARDIEKVLQEYVRTPQVNVIVSNAVSTYSQVKGVGQFKNPQALPYREGLRVLDLVLAMGGLTDYAAGNRAKIVRQVDGKQQELRVKLKELLAGGDMKQNLELRAGDVVIVPSSIF